MIQSKKRRPLKDYILGFPESQYSIIPHMIGNFGQKINCSIQEKFRNCEPISFNTSNGPIIIMKAIKSIQENEQIFWNYNSSRNEYQTKGFI